jgi:predicted DNA-binding mobile mystery protein A
MMIVRQLDKKTQLLMPLKVSGISEGWVRLVRTSLNMSLKQLGKKMLRTPQSVHELEQREKEGTVTLNTLREAAKALDMKLIYGFAPVDGSLEKMIEQKAHKMAIEIVNRTSMTMKLEDQENSQARIKQAIEELTNDIKREIPKTLWD